MTERHRGDVLRKDDDDDKEEEEEKIATKNRDKTDRNTKERTQMGGRTVYSRTYG